MRMLCAMAVISASLLSACALAQKPAPAQDAFSCAVQNGSVIVHLPGKTAADEGNPQRFGIAHAGDFFYMNAEEAGAAHTAYAASTRRLELPVASQRGTLWHDGHAEERRIFSSAGSYTLMFMDNLETEPENTRSLVCTVDVPTGGE